MIALYIVLAVTGLSLLWIIIDIVRALMIKPIPDLPEEFLDPSGLSKIYHYLAEPDKAPVKVDEEYILDCLAPSIKYINNRYDCADFRLQLLFRLYKDFYDVLPDSVRQLIKKTCLDFKYWMDEPGKDSMCYWSENHQLLFAVSKYLHGQEWQDEVFTNSGLTGREHMTKALKRINIWIEQRFKYGFFEWHSNNYYAEDIAPMSNYIQYSEDADSVERMKIVFDLLWYDIATHSVINTFVSVSSRMYGDNKSSDIFGNRIKAAMDAVWGVADVKTLLKAKSDIEERIMSGGTDIDTTVKLVGVDAQMMQNFIAMYKTGVYKVPDIIKEIALDNTPVEIKSSSGLDVSELYNKGLVGQKDNQIMAQLGSEAFTNPEVIENTLKYLNKNKMFHNKFVHPFSYINITLLRMMKIPRLISRKFDLMTNGIALNRGNVYCYRTAHYMLSTAMKMDVDSCGAQAHIWTLNIAPDLCLYTTHPARDDDSRDKHGASPGYWVGNGRQPMSVQDKNVNITIYKIPDKKRLLEFHLSDITHAFVPKEKYDEIILEKGSVFLRRGRTIIAMITNGEFSYRPYDAYAASLLIQHDKLVEKIPKINIESEFDLTLKGGRYHTYITEVSDTEAESFDAFIKRIKGNSIEFNGSGVVYHTDNREFTVVYPGEFKINGKDIDTDYRRLDSKYSVAPREADTIAIGFNGRKWRLNLEEKERKYV